MKTRRLAAAPGPHLTPPPDRANLCLRPRHCARTRPVFEVFAFLAKEVAERRIRLRAATTAAPVRHATDTTCYPNQCIPTAQGFRAAGSKTPPHRTGSAKTPEAPAANPDSSRQARHWRGNQQGNSASRV